jgi:hypothetical protein
MSAESKGWWQAGAVGGLCGAVLALVVNRWLPPAVPPPSPAPAPQEAETLVDEGAKQFVQRCLSHIKNHRLEEFAQEAKQSRAVVAEEDLKKFLERLQRDRELSLRSFGPPLGEYELLRVTAPSPSLVRFIYLERFERGAVWWVFVLYRTPERWQMAWVDWGANLAILFAGLS